MTGTSTPCESLRVGLLACDTVDAPLGETHGQYADMFARLLTSSAPQVELRLYRVHADEFPASVDECDAWLVSGSRRSVYEDLPWIARLAAFLRALHTARRRTVGICFGHQLIGHALGGHAARAPQGWGLGAQRSAVLEARPWMQPPARDYTLYAVHQDQVLTLPPGATRLATNPHCENAMFVLDEVMLGVQGHPEFERAYAEAITANKRGLAPDALVDAALGGMAAPTDGALLARWLLNFLCGATPHAEAGKT